MIVTQKWSPAGESDEFMGIIRIPTGLVPTDLGGSQFISLTYFVEVCEVTYLLSINIPTTTFIWLMFSLQDLD